MTSRRRFLTIIPLAGAATFARAQGAVDPKDPTAVGLGFVEDATKADKAKFPKYTAGQACGNCVLFQGAAGAASGPCPIFGNKQVPAKGWCNAYVKKG
jgi:hypothetical protein